MHEYTPGAAQTIESYDRQIAHRVNVDWNNNGSFDHPLSDLSNYVVSTSRDQAISSTAPDELMLIEGYGSAALDIDIAGHFDGYPLSGHFSPYNSRSIFYAQGLQMGVDIKYWIGVWNGDEWEWFQQFTGVVSEVESDRASGVVKLRCLDNVERLRNEVDIAAYGIPLEPLQQGFKRGGLVDSSSIIDLAARSGGFYKGHVYGQRWYNGNEINSILRVPFHGSILPEIGALKDGYQYHRTEVLPTGSPYSEMYTSGPFGYLALNAVPPGSTGQEFKRYVVEHSQTPDSIHQYGSWGLSTWLYFPENPADRTNSTVINYHVYSQSYQLIVDAGNSSANARFQGASGTYYMSGDTWMPLEPGWNLVEALFQVSTGPGGWIQAHTKVGDSQSPLGNLYIGDVTTAYRDDDFEVGVENRYRLSDLEVIYTHQHRDWARYMERKPTYDTRDTAAIDWGRNRFTHVHRNLGKNAWDLIKEVAAAEYGVVFFDEHGKLKFWNFENVLSMRSNEVARTFSLDQVEGLSLRTTMDSVRNQWVVTTTTGYADDACIYDLAKDGVPLHGPHTVAQAGNLLGQLVDPPNDTFFRPADFRVSPRVWEHFWIPLKPEVVTFYTHSADNTPAWNTAWNPEWPIHAKKSYHGDEFAGLDDSTRQYMESNGFLHLGVFNRHDLEIGFWLNSKNEGRFRLGGTVIQERDPETWTFSTTNAVEGDPNPGAYAESIDRYGIRSIELSNNYWLQDKFQTREMLKKVVRNFGRPIPVTDDITVPGDPRVQIGDIVEVQDPDGMGGSIHLQIYGIRRGLAEGTGLTDTYQVEVIEPPGGWKLGDPDYSILGQSTILG